MTGWILRSVLLAAFLAEPRDIERQVHAQINAERVKARLKPMTLDAELSAVARAHSRDMAQRRYFAHLNPDGKTPTERGAAAGYTCRVVQDGYVRTGLAENIYGTGLYRPVAARPGPLPYLQMKTAEELALTAVRDWMRSSGHRMNILRSVYRKTGIGVAVASDDRVLITQMFC